MAEFYLDHGAYASNIGAVPTWGVPQEGDGSAISAAIASSIASIAFTSVPTAGTFSCCGVTISTTGVIGAASADAAANALATNINATTTAVGSSVAVGVPQLRNLVFARGPSGGAPAGTCQIMTRVGSTSLNYANNTSAAIATTFDGAPTLTQFSGGSGGCWGWFVNSAAIGVSSSIAVCAYGLSVALPMVSVNNSGTRVLHGSLDEVYVRTGTNKTITLPTGQSFNRGAVASINLVFDTNTKWTGDSNSGVFTLEIVASNGANHDFTIDNSGTSSYQVSWISIRKGGMVVLCNLAQGSATINIKAQVFSGSRQHFRNITFREKAGAASSSYMRVNAQAAFTTTPARFDGCTFDWSATTTGTLKSNILVQGGDRTFFIQFVDCDFNWTLNGVPFDTVAVLPAFSYGNELGLHFRRCRFTTGNAAPLKAFTATSGWNTSNRLVDVLFDDCQGIKVETAFLGLASATNLISHLNRGMYQSRDTGRSMRYETRAGIAAWDYLASPAYPTLAAQQPDGTPWSMRIDWYSTFGFTTAADPFVSPAMSLFNRLDTAPRTAVIQLFLDSTKTINTANFAVNLSYVDSTGTVRQETSAFSPDTFTDSTATWTNSASYTNFVAKKITLPTQYSVKKDTEVSIEVVLSRQMLGGNTYIFVDPEFSLT